MKKFVFILGILLSINCGLCTSPILDNLENSLYGFTYTNSDDVTRLSRIEQSVYGTEKKGTIQERINTLKKDMSAELIGKEIPPKEDTFAEDEDKIVHEKPHPTGTNVDYPSINELEKQVLKKEFKEKDLNTRLLTLEKQALGETFDNEPFSTRVERLQAKIKPKSFMNNNIAQSSNSYFEDDIIPLDKNYKLDEYHSPDFDYESYNANKNSPANLAAVEKSVFKRTFTNENTENRITRLETTMFGTTFEEDNTQTRINRISSAHKATKSAGKYDSNRFSQNMATAMQIGTMILMILACVL